MAFTASRPIPGQANTVSIKTAPVKRRSEEHTSELQSQSNLVCRLLLEKKKKHAEYLAPHLNIDQRRCRVHWLQQQNEVPPLRVSLPAAESVQVREDRYVVVDNTLVVLP